MLSQNDSIADQLQGVHARRRREIDRRQGGARRAGRSTSPTSTSWAAPGRTRGASTTTSSFDEKTGYQRAFDADRADAVSAGDEVIGVIQLINRSASPRRACARPDDFDERGDAVRRAVRGAGAGAGVAGRHLARERHPVRGDPAACSMASSNASVTAIESRDPTTSGHSRRVATLTGRRSPRRSTRVDRRALRATSTSRATTLKQIEYAGSCTTSARSACARRCWSRRRSSTRRSASRAAALRLHPQGARGRARSSASCDWWRWSGGARRAAARFAELDAELRGEARRARRAPGRSSSRPTSRRCWSEGGFERLVEIARLQYLDAAGEPRPYLERRGGRGAAAAARLA